MPSQLELTSTETTQDEAEEEALERARVAVEQQDAEVQEAQEEATEEEEEAEAKVEETEVKVVLQGEDNKPPTTRQTPRSKEERKKMLQLLEPKNKEQKGRTRATSNRRPLLRLVIDVA